MSPKKMKCNNCKRQGDPNSITARCLSYDKFLEDNSDDNKKRFEPFQESNVEEIVLLKIQLERLIEQFENINKEYANIIRLLYEGYDKAEIIEQLGIDKGKTQAYAGIHRNHHFDTIERLHPLNTGDAPPSIRLLDQTTLHFMEDCRVVFSFMKKEILQRQGSNISFFLL